MRTCGRVDVRTTYQILPLLMQVLLPLSANVWIHEEGEKEGLVRRYERQPCVSDTKQERVNTDDM